MKVSTFSIGDNQDAALRRLAELIAEGQEDPRVIALARKITNDCPSRDDLCELQALYDAVKNGDPLTRELAKGFKYRSDPKSMDFFAGAGRLLSMCEHGACGGDCLPLNTLVLRNDHRVVPIGQIAVGTTIMGDGEWTTVTNTWDKGVLPILQFVISNSPTPFRCTADHRVFRIPKGKLRGDAEEVSAKDIRLDDELLTIGAIYDREKDLLKPGEPLPEEMRAWVKAIGELPPAMVCDIETSSGRFYLPETDLVVHNCDEHTVLLGSLAGAIGFTVGARAYGKSSEQSDPYVHVYAVALLPKAAQLPVKSLSGFGSVAGFGKIIGMDTTMTYKDLGWQPPPGHYRTAWVVNEE